MLHLVKLLPSQSWRRALDVAMTPAVSPSQAREASFFAGERADGVEVKRSKMLERLRP